eukprot:GFUD01088222.1.p1 GENE.GFUD01088222.1~~GFUD01088222.1.p1  ORF type:complete len:338 (+),score=87.59 GFUD01088222.1:223-1236(+)
MVLLIDGHSISSTLPVSQLHTEYQLLKANSLSVLNRPAKLVGAGEKCLYVGQRELAVVAPGDNVNMVGSEDATTCHVVILRDIHTGVTGLAHLDNEEPNDFLRLEKEVRDRNGYTKDQDILEYSVSILGGYEDENSTSEEITEMLLAVMQGLKAKFTLQLACTGSLNTVMKEGVPWPRVYGGGVDVSTGEVFTAKFSYHGPDTDIRSLRLHSPVASLNNIYDPYGGKIVLKPFSYRVMPDAHLWLKKADSFILKYCSTSPLVEPPDFCEHIRANFRRMISDPRPMESLFPGGRNRVYERNEITGQWILELEGISENGSKISSESKPWGVNDFRMQFN